MEYKYGHVEKVRAKRNFEVFRLDDAGELVGVVTIPKNCEGTVESMGWSSTEGSKTIYDILFKEGDKEIEVGIAEDEMELQLEFL